LHEVAVVASFVAAHGEDLAERYVLHQAVESNRAAHDYKACQQRLGYEPLAEKEVEAVQRSYDAVIAKLGKDFGKGDYGWAAQHLGIVKPLSPWRSSIVRNMISVVPSRCDPRS